LRKAISSIGITGVIMLAEYLAILIYVAIAVVFALFAIAASALLGQRKPSALKTITLRMRDDDGWLKLPQNPHQVLHYRHAFSSV